MDLYRSMQVFVEIVQSGSMSAAAPKLGMSSAMVGQYCASLEKRLGTRLLNRTTRRQNLTSFGLSYFDQCKDILNRVELSELEAEALQNEALGKLRVTAPLTFGVSMLMPALKYYRQIAPKVELDIVLTDRNVDLIEECFDIAFRIGDLPDSRLIARKLMPYTMSICAAPSYLAVQGVPNHPSDLLNHEVVSFASVSGVAWTLSKGEEQVDVLPSSKIVVNSGHALLASARAGLGIVMQPTILLSDDISEGNLVPLLCDWELGERHVSLLYYRDQHMTQRMRSFISFAVKKLSKANSVNVE